MKSVCLSFTCFVTVEISYLVCYCQSIAAAVDFAAVAAAEHAFDAAAWSEHVLDVWPTISLLAACVAQQRLAVHKPLSVLAS